MVIKLFFFFNNEKYTYCIKKFSLFNNLFFIKLQSIILVGSHYKINTCIINE